ncbi:MAG: hypothetical protein U1D31_02095 [Patescibacteria group bacterium]|nr:hypothetical protein [bacterium]MDZ4240893.1 hypothetical protein [Patescibacteria group bacterium]
MSQPLAKFAPYFVHCEKTKEFGFLFLSPGEKGIIVFSKSNARLHVEVAIKDGVIRKDESLELLRQIEASKMREKMDIEICVVILKEMGLNEVYGDCFSRSMYSPSRN